MRLVPERFQRRYEPQGMGRGTELSEKGFLHRFIELNRCRNLRKIPLEVPLNGPL